MKKNISKDNNIENENAISNMKINIEMHSNSIEILNKEKKEKKILKIKIIIAIIYYILIISSEFSYRKKLFSKSIELEEKIQENYEKDCSFEKFWKLISHFGTAKITMFTWIIIFSTFPINYSFQYLQSIIYTSYLTNLFKMFYRNNRPYWESEKIIFACNSGYGNPSGHSMTSSCVYLSLATILTDFKIFQKNKKGIIFKVIIYFLFIILMFMIMSSRIILGAHSLNQVIYGFLLGLGNYFVIFYILSFHKYNNFDFLNFFQKKFNNLIFMIFHLVLVIITIITYFSVKESNIDEITKKIFNGVRCKIKKDYLMFKNDGLYQSLSISAVIGAHLGILILIMLIEKKFGHVSEKLIIWNRVIFKYWLFRLPILIVSGIGIILYFLIPGKWNLALVFIFKSIIPFFLATFGLYSFGIYYSIYYGFSYYQVDYNNINKNKNENENENEYQNGKEIPKENIKESPIRIEMHKLDENKK